jgi:hypothetical protein
MSELPSIPAPASIFDSMSIHEPGKKYSELKNIDSNLSLIAKNTNNTIVTSNTKSSFHSDVNMIGEINFNFNLEHSESAEDIDSSDEEEEHYYDSFENPSQIERLQMIKSQDFIKVEIEENYFKSSLSLRQNIIRNELPTSYVYIDVPRNRRKEQMSKSLLNYLNTSVNFLKESYTYFYNYNSI